MSAGEIKVQGSKGQSPGTDYTSLSNVGYDEKKTNGKLRSAITLLVIFCTVYFVAAMIATPEFASIARIEIAGLPMAFYTGILVFAVGIVVTRMCLNLDKGE
ncbi:MAG: hypothetical protein ACFE0R_09330 [Salinarimonas sp.]